MTSEIGALAAALDAARRGRLYPALIVHGATDADRRAAAIQIARTLLCEMAPEARPCPLVSPCRHCRRILDPVDAAATVFHPDVAFLVRDLKTSTSADASRALLQGAQMSPFEARGQVFVVLNAESLTPEAANAFLKVLEEPPVRAPRHFLLLAPAALDLLATLRSRSLAVFLGPGVGVDAAAVEQAARRFASDVDGWLGSGSAVWLLAAASTLLAAGSFEDPRSITGWAAAAATARRAAEDVPRRGRRAILELAHDLLAAPEHRLRGIPAERIIEALVSRHLATL